MNNKYSIIAICVSILIGLGASIGQAGFSGPGSGGGGVPSGPAGGDLGGTYPNPTVIGGSHITNASIANSAMANPYVTVNTVACTLGGSCTITATASGSAGGDLSGSYPNPTVAQINGGVIPTSGIAKFNASKQLVAAVSNTDYAAANAATTVNGVACAVNSTCTITAAASGTAGGDLSGTYPNPTVAQINGGVIPTSGIAKFNASKQLVAAVSNTDYAAANAATTVNGVACAVNSSCTITVPANALTGTALASTVVTSSLTSAAGGNFGSFAYLSPSPISAQITGTIALNNSTYTDGPNIAQGSTGRWYVSGNVNTGDSAAVTTITCKLWDGTNIIAQGQTTPQGTQTQNLTLGGYSVNGPPGNLRISCLSTAPSTSYMEATFGYISAFRIQ